MARDKNRVDKGNNNSSNNSRATKGPKANPPGIHISNKKKKNTCINVVGGGGGVCVCVQKFIKRKETHRKYAEILGATAARIIFK